MAVASGVNCEADADLVMMLAGDVGLYAKTSDSVDTVTSSVSLEVD